MSLVERVVWPIGIMQGRLSAPVEGRVQAFPFATWREEFDAAARLGLASIEWIVETPVESNPLWTTPGRRDIQASCVASGVRVSHVCADVFMTEPLVRLPPGQLAARRTLLTDLIARAADLSVQAIDVPCVDESALRTPREEDELARTLSPILDIAARHGVTLSLELSLPPARVRALLALIDHPAVAITYDTGNSASWGYDPDEEFESYGWRVGHVHIKDRIRGGGTVPLGTGSADIPRILRGLHALEYHGDLILQVARGADDLAVARDSQALVRRWSANACDRQTTATS
jgi:L-ribulose-5-phosphate 3-epimerase